MAAAGETMLGAVGVRAVRGSRPRTDSPSAGTSGAPGWSRRASTRAGRPAPRDPGGTRRRPGWIERARRLAGRAGLVDRGSDRVAARARERWAEQVTAQRAATAGPGGDATWPAAPRVAAVESSARAQRTTGPRPAGGAPRWRFSRPRDPAASPDPRPCHSRPPQRPAGDLGEDLVTGWCLLPLVLGLYFSGWNHLNRSGDGPVLALARSAVPGVRGHGGVDPHPAPAARGLVAVVGGASTGWRWSGWGWPWWRSGMPCGTPCTGWSRGWPGWSRRSTWCCSPGASPLVSSALRAAWSGPSSALRRAGVLAGGAVDHPGGGHDGLFFQYVSPVVAWRRPAWPGWRPGPVRRDRAGVRAARPAGPQPPVHRPGAAAPAALADAAGDLHGDGRVGGPAAGHPDRARAGRPGQRRCSAGPRPTSP